MGKSRVSIHTIVAAIILIAAALWIATGTFSSVGSDASPDTSEGNATGGVGATLTSEALQTVAFILANPDLHQRDIWLSGQTKADKRVVLVARTSGTVARLPVVEGDALAEGDLVMELEGRDRVATLASAEAQFDLADHQAESDKVLVEDGNLPKLRYEASVAAREAARSAVEIARSEVERLELRAPFGGVVDRLSVEVGSWVQSGTEVAILLSLDPIVVSAEIGERDLQWLLIGAPATVSFGNGTTAEGVVRYITREATALTRTFPIEIAVPNSGGSIPSGMSADIMIGVETALAVMLKRSAITLDTDGTLGVRVLADDDTAGFLKVEILDDTPDGLVVSGVPDGTRIIVSGQDMVTNGQAVAAVPASGADM